MPFCASANTSIAQDEADELFCLEPLFGRTFQEQLLLALIDAHPERKPKGTEAQDRNRRADRLRIAMGAIFAQKPQSGHPPEHDIEALRWMGQQRVNDKARKQMREIGLNAAWTNGVERSIRSLASAAAEKFYPKDAQDVSGRLRSKFRKQEKRWVDVAMFHNDVPEMQEYHALTKIAEILGRHGVATKLKLVQPD